MLLTWELYFESHCSAQFCYLPGSPCSEASLINNSGEPPSWTTLIYKPDTLLQTKSCPLGSGSETLDFSFKMQMNLGEGTW